MSSKTPNYHDEIRRKTLKSLLTGGVAATLGISGWSWLLSRKTEDGIPWPLRKILGFNEMIWRSYFNPNRVGLRPAPSSPGRKVRINGTIGLNEGEDLEEWEMEISSPIESQ